jgi:hypothetical protein
VVPASADPITIAGGTAGTIPAGGSNSYVSAGFFPGPSIGGYYGATINVSVPVQSTITFDFFGADTQLHNEFNFFGSELFDHPGGTIISPNLNTPLATFSTTIVGSGALPFRFDVNSDASSVANGANPNNFGGGATGPNFFVSCNPFGGAAGSGGTNCSTLYIFLDDVGGKSGYNGSLVRVSFPQIPEPASFGLMALVLTGLGMAARQRRRA